MVDSLTLKVDELQKIYKELQPVSAQNLADGNCTESDLSDINKTGIDMFLTDIDLSKSQQSGKGAAPGFMHDKVWYADASLLKKIYEKAVAMDKADGSFDGKIIPGKEDQIRITISESENVESNLKDKIDPFLKSIFSIKSTSRMGTRDMLGTAWVIERESLGKGKYRNWIITNAHVVDSEGIEEVKFEVTAGKKTYRAALKGADHTKDIAVLYFDSTEQFPTIPAAKQPQMHVGDGIVIVGNQLGQGIVQVPGTINATEKFTGYRMPLIQDDSSAKTGNSGSPVFDADARVIGVCNSGANDGENYSVPIGLVLDSYRKIREHGRAIHGQAEFEGMHLPKDALEAYGISKEFENGFFVRDVYGNWKTKKDSLQVEDIILRYDGKPVPDENNSDKLDYDMSLKPVGSEVEFLVYRKGKYLKIMVPITEWIDAPKPTYETPFDFSIAEIDPQTRRENGFSEDQTGLGVYLCSHHYEASSGIGTFECDLNGILTAINGASVDSIERFKKMSASSREDVLVFHILKQENGRLVVSAMKRTNRLK